ncbi:MULTISPECIES: molecular chaperone DnaJ [unclassified Salmonella]|uniref:molecular chaperone DnaJ n=1 Tax=Salmonella sp. YP101-1 TaxID=2908495 RepID=UPI0012748957|nr:molecular chaperone DnaJ [Salmonella sp. YP101-1]EBQ6639249.1 molecular chaperone DnaJ [Salmonella enterica]ECG5243526.1 molecular chaperone DnaJ [Salmonella enterica subsp. enterica serovar Anatum]
MTTITNKKQYPSEQYLNELITNMEFAAMAPVEVVRVMAAELQERRKADNKEPAGYHVIRECGKVGCSVATLEEAEKTRDFWNKKWTIRPYFYTAQPAQETGVYKDMLNIIGLLENNEWAEHCTSTVLGSLLESEITRLVGKEQPAPVVPDEMPKGLAGQIVSLLAHNIGDKFLAKKIWNACRAAMLQDNQRDLSQPVDPQVAEYEQIMLQAGNSPVTPDGWVIVPKKLTAENGAKGVLSGEFSETTFISCPECFGDDDCDTCDGSGRIEIKVPVTWTTIKSIWDKGIAHFAAKPPQEVNRG